MGERGRNSRSQTRADRAASEVKKSGAKKRTDRSSFGSTVDGLPSRKVFFWCGSAFCSGFCNVRHSKRTTCCSTTRKRRKGYGLVVALSHTGTTVQYVLVHVSRFCRSHPGCACTWVHTEQSVVDHAEQCISFRSSVFFVLFPVSSRFLVLPFPPQTNVVGGVMRSVFGTLGWQRTSEGSKSNSDSATSLAANGGHFRQKAKHK